MNTNGIFQITSAVVLAMLAVLLVNPFDFWMPTMLHMAVLAAAVVVSGAFSIFVLSEKAADERDNEHRQTAGRAAFLAGGAVLLAGIVIETLQHALDPWLVWALLIMVATKAVARFYSTRYR
jgi:hypothetical protein